MYLKTSNLGTSRISIYSVGKFKRTATFFLLKSFTFVTYFVFYDSSVIVTENATNTRIFHSQFVISTTVTLSEFWIHCWFSGFVFHLRTTRLRVSAKMKAKTRRFLFPFSRYDVTGCESPRTTLRSWITPDTQFRTTKLHATSAYECWILSDTDLYLSNFTQRDKHGETRTVDSPPTMNQRSSNFTDGQVVGCRFKISTSTNLAQRKVSQPKLRDLLSWNQYDQSSCDTVFK